MLYRFTIAQGGQKRPTSKPKFRSSLKTTAGGQLRQDFNTYYQYISVDTFNIKGNQNIANDPKHVPNM